MDSARKAIFCRKAVVRRRTAVAQHINREDALKNLEKKRNTPKRGQKGCPKGVILAIIREHTVQEQLVFMPRFCKVR